MIPADSETYELAVNFNDRVEAARGSLARAQGRQPTSANQARVGPPVGVPQSVRPSADAGPLDKMRQCPAKRADYDDVAPLQALMHLAA